MSASSWWIFLRETRVKMKKLEEGRRLRTRGSSCPDGRREPEEQTTLPGCPLEMPSDFCGPKKYIYMVWRLHTVIWLHKMTYLRV